MTHRERMLKGYHGLLDGLARRDSLVDRLEMTIDKNREYLSDEKIQAGLDSCAKSRAQIAQDRARVQEKAKEFGLI